MNYELHPLCTLFPRLEGNEFESLCADIKANGLRNPIVIHEGMILDGGNRYRACVESGVEPEFIEFRGSNIVSFVLSANLHRRHLSPGQQAAIVSSAQDWSKAQSVGNPQLQKCNGAPLVTVEDRALQSGASIRTQKMADKVAKADPDLAKQVAHGKISLPKAVEKISPTKQKDTEQEMTREQYELIELKESNAALYEENTRLKDALSVNQIPDDVEMQSASQIIDELRSHIKTLEVELDSVKTTRDGLYIKVKELESQCKWYQSKLKKVGMAQ